MRGEEFSVANVRLVSRAIAQYVRATTVQMSPAVLVGYDTRFLSERFAGAAASALAEGGVSPMLATAAAPTPAVAFHVLRHRLAGGGNDHGEP